MSETGLDRATLDAVIKVLNDADSSVGGECSQHYADGFSDGFDHAQRLIEHMVDDLPVSAIPEAQTVPFSQTWSDEKQRMVPDPFPAQTAVVERLREIAVALDLPIEAADLPSCNALALHAKGAMDALKNTQRELEVLRVHLRAAMTDIAVSPLSRQPAPAPRAAQQSIDDHDRPVLLKAANVLLADAAKLDQQFVAWPNNWPMRSFIADATRLVVRLVSLQQPRAETGPGPFPRGKLTANMEGLPMNNKNKRQSGGPVVVSDQTSTSVLLRFLTDVCDASERIYADDSAGMEARALASARHAIARQALAHLYSDSTTNPAALKGRP